MPAHKLILLPENPLCPPVDCGQLADVLQSIGLIGEPLELENRRFFPTGDRFLQLISFLGCSPMIELEPPTDRSTLASASADGKFCHLFLDCSKSLVFRTDSQCPPARCPDCRQPVADWRNIIENWKYNPAQADWTCASCDYHGPFTGLNLRKAGGFGRTFIEIRGIYPSEAVPTDTLLASLQRLTDAPWKTIYIKE